MEPTDDEVTFEEDPYPGWVQCHSSGGVSPKEAPGAAKPGTSIMSNPVSYEVCLALRSGARKYGSHNQRVCDVRASTYYDAARRHLDAWWEGQDRDGETHLAHLAHAIASLYILRDAQIMGTCTDDRPPRAPEGWLEVLEVDVARLSEGPGGVPPYTDKQQGEP